MISAIERISPIQVAQHYDDLDPFYRKIWGEHLHHGLWRNHIHSPDAAVKELVRHVAQLGAIGPGSRVCDVGCGYGATTRQLAREFGATVTGVTISRAQYRFASTQPQNGHTRYVWRDWLKNDFPERQYDAVIAIESIEHFADKPAAFAEACRVLKPGGRMVVCSWLSPENPSPWQENFLLRPICSEGCLPQITSARELERIMVRAGMQVLSVEDVSKQVQKTWTIAVSRVLKGLVTQASYRDFLLRNPSENRVFASTMLKIWLAYWVGAMHYGILVAERPKA